MRYINLLTYLLTYLLTLLRWSHFGFESTLNSSIVSYSCLRMMELTRLFWSTLPDTIRPPSCVGQRLRAPTSRSVRHLMTTRRDIATELSPSELKNVAVVPRSTCTQRNVTPQNTRDHLLSTVLCFFDKFSWMWRETFFTWRLNLYTIHWPNKHLTFYVNGLCIISVNNLILWEVAIV